MRLSLCSIAVFLILTQSSFASDVTDNRASVHVFAQFADGRFSDGSYYRSTVMIATDRLDTQCGITLLGMTAPGFGPTGSDVLSSLGRFRRLYNTIRPFQR
jgi:hypothetical protein